MYLKNHIDKLIAAKQAALQELDTSRAHHYEALDGINEAVQKTMAELIELEEAKRKRKGNSDMTKNYIEVEVEYRDTLGENIYVDVEYFWAVRTTPSKGKSWKVTEEEPADFKEDTFAGSFVLNGGMPVHVSSKEDIEGLRKLLDAIEEELINE